MDPRKVVVQDIKVAVPAGAGVEAGMVTLRETEGPGRELRIVIGQPEARAIQSAWLGLAPPRPSTWDLLVSAVAVLGGRVDRAVITAVEGERHFFAQIEIERGDERRVLEARPSDAIALALRSADGSIYVTEGVLTAVGAAPTG